MKPGLARSLIALGFWLTLQPSLAQPLPPSQETEAPAQPELAAIAPPEKTRILSFATMGQPNGVKLTGVSRFVDLSAGIRLDELVKQAKLELKLLYPAGMRHDQSFIRVYVNNQLSTIHQLSETKAGVIHTVNLDLDPVLFSDFATVRIEYDGTYDAQCVAPQNPTLRVDIRPESSLTIVSTPLNLVNDLALLPAPFFDPRDNSKLKTPLVLPVTRSQSNVRAAGVLASWLGAQAFYRQAEFDVMELPAQNRHSIVLSTGDLMPAGMSKQEIQGPMLVIDSLVEKPWIKQLYVLGRNDEELMQAVYGLVIEGQVLSGQKALVKSVSLGAARKPYDAPRYVPTDRPVRFAELIDFPGQLEVSSDKPRTSVSLRLPPDLFSWTGRNIPMDLKYRYTAPSRWNDSLLNIEINNALIQSFRLAPRTEQSQNKLGINLLGQAELSSEEALQIPAFRVGGTNELAFGFAFMPEGERNCSGVGQPARGAIDPESTLDFSDLPHYTQMPNLAAFANGGYPFSIMADMADTAVVLPQDPNSLEVRAFLNMMGLFGQWTGLPASRVTLLFGNNPNEIGDKHWIAMGTSDRLSWLSQSNMSLPMVLSDSERSMGMPPPVQWLKALWQSEQSTAPGERARALIQTAGSLGAILGFESHLQKQKAGVVITGTDQDSFERAVAAMSNYNDVAKIRGSVSLIRGDEIQSYNLGDTYISGSLPWWLTLRIVFSQYPALIAVSGALAGVLLAILAYGWLSGRASRRTRGQ
ncbi:MAG TPA: cellulose biosynthesis cyclic di-GMP-binding regulatory protein BcsB [Limnobacter sp.]|nr:cellulose biosynthesis cyclic di-GMP-binding regulatory protein BcsB [Limnobacter sp.]